MRYCVVALLVVVPLVTMPAAAQTLDTDGAKKLVVGQTWAESKPEGYGKNYWSWKKDGTLCIRLWEPNGKCDDTGKWSLDAGRVCYELGWWGNAYSSDKSGCFRISQAGKGGYRTIRDDGFAMSEFTVLK